MSLRVFEKQSPGELGIAYPSDTMSIRSQEYQLLKLEVNEDPPEILFILLHPMIQLLDMSLI